MEEELKKEKQGESLISRRYFLEIIGGGAIGTVALGGAVLMAEYLSPNVLHEPPLKFRAGLVEDYPPNTVNLVVDQKAYVVRAKEGYFYAMSAVCTHLGCITAWEADEDIIACPCHGSRFDREGNVIHGPAPQPLARFSITLDEHGELLVDKGSVVGDDVILRV